MAQSENLQIDRSIPKTSIKLIVFVLIWIVVQKATNWIEISIKNL